MKKIGLVILLLLSASFMFSQVGTYEIQFVSNNDGDTFKGIVRLPSMSRKYTFDDVRVSVRLYNVDTYEVSGRYYNKQTEKQKELARDAKYYVRNLLSSSHTIRVQLLYKDRHKRWVCKVYMNDDPIRLGLRLKSKGLTSGKYEDLKRPKVKVRKTKS